MEHSADGMKGCMYRDIWGVFAVPELTSSENFRDLADNKGACG